MSSKSEPTVHSADSRVRLGLPEPNGHTNQSKLYVTQLRRYDTLLFGSADGQRGIVEKLLRLIVDLEVVRQDTSTMLNLRVANKVNGIVQRMCQLRIDILRAASGCGPRE